jgi:hypothetical protein
MDGRINSEKYHDFTVKEEYIKIKSDIPLKDASLEGAWQLKGAEWGGKPGEASVNNFEQIKIYSYPRFAWAQYNQKTKQFFGAGGGTYQYDGKKLVEHIEYMTYNLALSTDYLIEVKKLADGTLQQVSQEGMFKEIWQRLQ